MFRARVLPAALQQGMAQLKTEQQGHLVQLDALMRDNARLKEAKSQDAEAARGAHDLCLAFAFHQRSCFRPR